MLSLSLKKLKLDNVPPLTFVSLLFPLELIVTRQIPTQWMCLPVTKFSRILVIFDIYPNFTH